MSWSSRFSSLAPGRWSPFTSRTPSSNTISDSDFSYITAEDLDEHVVRGEQQQQQQQQHHHHHQSSQEPQTQHHSHTQSHHPHSASNSKLSSTRSAKETDVLILKHKKTTYPVHFPAFSIDDGNLLVGDIRKYAAKKLDIRDVRRVRLYYKGRNLKENDWMCRDMGMHSDGECEIMVVVHAAIEPEDDEDSESDRDRSRSAPAVARGGRAGHGLAENDRDDGNEDNDNDDDDDSRAGTPTTGTGEARRKRNRNKRKNNKKRGGNTSTSAESPGAGRSYTSTAQTVEYLPTAGVVHPAAKGSTPTPSSTNSTSRTASPAVPQGPLEKLSAIASTFHTTLVPQCVQFTHSPPTDKTKREFEHKKLTETILAQVLLKLDAVETDGNDEARSRRKELVKETQAMLTRLDKVMNP